MDEMCVKPDARERMRLMPAPVKWKQICAFHNQKAHAASSPSNGPNTNSAEYWAESTPPS